MANSFIDKVKKAATFLAGTVGGMAGSDQGKRFAKPARRPTPYSP
jgi:hypothetical protein